MHYINTEKFVPGLTLIEYDLPGMWGAVSGAGGLN